MRHPKTYMYIIFFSKLELVDQSKTGHTNLFAKNGKLHKFATTNSNFEKINSFRHASS